MTNNGLHVVGQSVPRRDGLGHVTGKTVYVDDISFPETKAYVKKVLEKQREYKHEYALELGY